MPVDDSYSLQDTLARIRQRYALHFSLPPGVQAGEERNIQLELAGAIRSRYPGAEVRYRHSYYAPSGAGSHSTGSSEPVVVTGGGTSETAGNPAPPADPDRPALRRRAGVSQVPDTPRGGPVIHDDGPLPATPPPAASGPASSQGGWRKADPGSSPAPAPDPPGWRKARPGEQP
jgi:hypothetical protein